MNTKAFLDEEFHRAIQPALKRITIAVALSIVAMALFVYVAHEMLSGQTIELDRRILGFFAGIKSREFHEAMLLISILAGPIFQSLFWAGAVAWFTYKKRFWPDGASLIFAGAGGLMLIVGLKYLFHRPRPYAIFSHLSYSFPSGHSFFALVLYGMTAYWLTRDLHEPHQKAIWAATGLMVLLVGFSRVALGEHFPSDVVAGYAVALPWLWASLAIPQTFHRSGRDLTTAEASRSLLSIL